MALPGMILINSGRQNTLLKWAAAWQNQQCGCAPIEKIQIGLGILPVWSESSLSAWRKLGSLATHWAHSEDSDQTGSMPRMIWVFAGRTYHFVRFVMRRLKSNKLKPSETFLMILQKYNSISIRASNIKKLWKYE